MDIGKEKKRHIDLCEAALKNAEKCREFEDIVLYVDSSTIYMPEKDTVEQITTVVEDIKEYLGEYKHRYHFLADSGKIGIVFRYPKSDVDVFFTCGDNDKIIEKYGECS